MEHYRQPYSLYRRATGSKNRAGKPVYRFYYRTYLPSGKRGPGKSTGKSTENDARIYVEGVLEHRSEQHEHIPAAGSATSAMLSLKQYTTTWWTPEHRYCRRRIKRGTLSVGHMKTQRSFLKTWILPRIGERRLDELTVRALEDWLADLEEHTHLSATSVNHVRGCLRTILREAVRLGDLPADPMGTVEPLDENRKRKGTLTVEEVRVLLSDAGLDAYWSMNLPIFTMNLLACSTGMRMGECQGLQRQHIHPGWVDVRRAWRRTGELAPEPKKGSIRAIPLYKRVEECLAEVMEDSPYKEPEALVFGGKDAKPPIDQTLIHRSFLAALDAFGIKDAARRTRALSFHSHRVFFNTWLLGQSIPESKVRAVTGHRTEEMTALYTAYNPSDFKDVRKAQGKLFPEAKK